MNERMTIPITEAVRRMDRRQEQEQDRRMRDTVAGILFALGLLSIGVALTLVWSPLGIAWGGLMLVAGAERLRA